MKDNLTETQIQDKINFYKQDFSKKGRVYLDYYNLLLEYKREEADVKLRKRIKQSLGVNFIGGKYTAKEIGKVLGIGTGKVNSIEGKVIRILKHPTKSRNLKKYLQQGV